MNVPFQTEELVLSPTPHGQEQVVGMRCLWPLSLHTMFYSDPDTHGVQGEAWACGRQGVESGPQSLL